jgi:hypothetical protein
VGLEAEGQRAGEEEQRRVEYKWNNILNLSVFARTRKSRYLPHNIPLRDIQATQLYIVAPSEAEMFSENVLKISGQLSDRSHGKSTVLAPGEGSDIGSIQETNSTKAQRC